MMVVRLILAVACAVIAGTVAMGSATAAETRSGDEITISAGQQIQGDLYVFGRDVVIAGIVDGDLIGAAETVTISGTVNGSVNVAARSVDIEGVITGSARVTGESATVSGTVEGDLVVGANGIKISTTGEVQGDVLIGNGDLTVSGPVGGDIRGSIADLTIGSRVGGDVRVSANSVEISHDARIAGDLRYASDDAAEVARAARVSGQTVRTSEYRFTGGPDAWSALTSHIARLLLGLVSGLFLVLLLPRPSIAVAESIRSRLPASVLLGLIAVIFWPILALAMLVILVGIPVALIGTALLICFAYLSQVFVGLAIGRYLLPSGWKVRSRGYNVLAMAIGVTLLGLVRTIPVPVISPAIALVTAFIGIGGVLLALHGVRTTEPA
jgi:hypothetical protein